MVKRVSAERLFRLSVLQAVLLVVLEAAGLRLAVVLVGAMMTVQGLGALLLLYLCAPAIPQTVRGMRTGDKVLVAPELKHEIFWLCAVAALQLGAVLMAAMALLAD